MAEANFSYVKNLLSKAKQARQKHESEISEAYSYTYPDRDIWVKDDHTGDRNKIYDNTALESVANLTSTVLSLLIPQNQQWAYIDVRSEVKGKIAPDIRRMLDTANKTVFNTLKNSNFYVAAGESITDCIISGTGAICVMNPMQGNGMDFMSIPTSQLYFLANYKDDIDVVFREHELSAQSVFERYGDQTPELLELAKKDPEKKLPVLEAVFREVGDTDFCYHVYVGKDMQLVSKDYMPVNPFIIFRFSKVIGQIWGMGPCRSALAHIRTVNEMQKMLLQSVSWQTMGAWMVNSDTTVNFSNMKLQPGEIITVDQPLQPVPFPGSFNVSQVAIQDAQSTIRRHLYNDAMLPPGESKYMTATEIQARQAEFYRRTAPFGLRLEQEFLRPLINTLVTKLQLRGLVPEFVLDNNAFELVVNSAVKKGIAMTEINRDMQLLSMVSQLGPEAMQAVDTAKLARKILTDGDMSPDVIRSEQEIQQKNEQMREQMAQQQLMQTAQQVIDPDGSQEPEQQ
tara:strand:- start:2142 stop:3677 length:1536 start_codon:yes stop_codon:yes gene_type:complete